MWIGKSHINRDVPNVSLISNRRKQIMNKSPKRKTSVYLDEKNLETIKGIQEEIQPLSQSDYQSLSSEIPPRDDCLDLRR